MKNFTNNFKQFTSRLSARWLIMALMMLVGTSSAWAVDYWVVGPAVGGWDQWKKMNQESTTRYTFTVNTGEFKITKAKNWDNANRLDNIICNDNNDTYKGNVTCNGANNHSANVAGTLCFNPNDSYMWIESSDTPIVGTKIQLAGSFNDWGNSTDICYSVDNSTCSFEKELAAKDKYEFMIIIDGTWYSQNAVTVDGSKVTFKNPWDANSSFKASKDGIYTFYVDKDKQVWITYRAACSAPTSVSISRGNPTTGKICQGSTIDLTANVEGDSGDITYVWENTSDDSDWTIDNASAQTCTVTAGTGSATFQITATGCGTDITNTITLEADAKPAITLASPSSICTGTEIDLTENYVTSKTGTVTWYSDANRSQEITNGIVTPINTGTSQTTNTYYAKVTNGVCSAKTDVSLSIKVDPQSAITLKAAPTICQGTTITFANYVNTHTGTVTWHTKSDFSDAAITSAKPSQTTTYYAKASSGDCTPATASLKVTVNDKPAVPTLSADKTSLVSPDKATLTAGNTTNGLTYTLYNDETAGESQTSTGGNLTFKVGETGNYTVRVSNSCGTSTSDVVTITVCTPQTNEFKHANSNYNQLQAQPTYYPGDKAYFVSTINCCLTGTWSANLQKGEEAWYTGLKGGTPRFYMTLTRAGEFTITNMATNDCTQDRNVLVNLDFTVTALSEVTNANGTASGADIALTWKHSTNHTKVMVVRYPTAGTETIPAGGQSYSAGNTLGGGTVVYVGTDEIYTDKNLPAGVSYKYYFYTVNNNYYSEGVVLNMSSCPTPAKPQLESTAVTTCNGNVTTFGSITITNIADYDNTYTFKLGDITANPDANGKIVISSAANTEYTVTVINSCGNQNSANVDIAINNITPTISGATIAQPGKLNAIELTVPTGINAKWSVSPAADFSVTEGNSTMFSAETNGTYTITATNGTCSDTHVVTVADAFYIYFRNAKESETAYAKFYDPNQNSEEVQGGEMFYAECDALPTNVNNSLPTHFVNYNKGGRKADIITTDCDGYTWYGFKASAEVVAGTKYFYVHATNDKNYNGHFTHTVPTKKTLTSDVYYTLGTTNHTTTHYGWNITLASAPYAGPKVYALGSTTLGTDKFAALYVTDCSGKEIDAYQWEYCRTQDGDYQPYSSVCSYTFEKKDVVKTETSDAGKTNNIRPSEFGYYRCKVTYKDGTTATSATEHILGSYSRSFTSNIPVLVVNTGSKGFPDCTGLSGQTASKNASTFKAKRSVDVKIYEGETLVYDRKARMNYRGSSSLNFVKKSYAFCPGDANCEEKDGQADYVKTAKLNMLGVGKACDKDWVLYAAAADPSLMRNRLVFDSYKAMTGKWGVNSRYVELIVDGVYKGVYVFMDKITMNTERVKVDEDKGFIVKFDKTDREDRVGGLNGVLGDEKTFKTSNTGKDDIGTYDTSIDQRFEIEYPEKDDYKTGWKARVDGIQGMFQAFEDALKQGDYATVQKYIDYTSWADWFIINEFTKNVDAYRASCIFVYTGEAGAKIEARPLWDQELSFNNQASKGTSDKGSDSTTGLLIQHSNVYSDAFKAPFWFTGGGSDITGGLLSDPCFVQVVKERWNMHQSVALSKKSLEDLVDQYEDDLAPEGTTENAQTRETAFWNGKSRGKCDCSYETGNATATGYQNKTFEESKGTITNWISDDAASDAKGRRAGLTTAINGLTGASFSIQILPQEAKTTPWEPVEITVSVTPAGYDYKLEYTGDNNLGGVANTIIKEEGDKIIYRIPRPDAWGTGNESVEGERTDIEYGIKATLSVQEGTTVCGSQAAPSSTGKIILQDEPNEKCD